MPETRPATVADVEGIADLHRRVYGKDQKPANRSLEDHFHALLFGHPWTDSGIESLVCESAGTIEAFVGRMPRPMWFRGEPLLSVISHNYMVDPESRQSSLGLELARAVLEGPQDLTMAYGNDASRKIWQVLKGRPSLTYSLCWVKPLRPARYAVSILQRRGLSSHVGRMLSPGLSLLDAGLTRVMSSSRVEYPPSVAARALHADEYPSSFCLVKRSALLPRYDARSAHWLLNTLAEGNRGELVARRLFEGEKAIGWYLFCSSPGETATVVQTGARPGKEALVLGHLMADARERGAAAIAGQVDPQMFEALARQDVIFRHDGQTWALFHSRRDDVLHAIDESKAFLSRAESEWLINFMYG